MNIQLSNEPLNLNQSSESDNLAVGIQNEGEMDVSEVSKVDSISDEASKIEAGFTDYIVPDQEKRIVSSIFEDSQT